MEALEHIYSNEEIIVLIKTSKSDNSYYYEMLYKNNYKLFYKLSYKYSNISWQYTIEDLMQECYFALIKTVEYYDNTVSPFYSYLWRITNQYLYSKVNNANNKEDSEKKKMAYVSLYETLCEDKAGNTQELIETIANEEAQRMIDAVPEMLFIESLKEAEIKAIDTLLTKREAECIKLYYGFDSTSYNTVEIAELLGVNVSRVNECLSNSYRKLRRDKELKKFWETEFLHR